MSQATAEPTSDIRFFDFGPFRVDAVNRLLLRDRKIVPLTSKVFDILLVFVSSTGRLLDKEDLMKQVWPESFVEEGNLTRNVSTLRKALGESPQEHQYIITVPGRGYRFVPRVSEVRDDSSALILEEHSRARIVIDEQEEEWPATRAGAVVEAEASTVTTAKWSRASSKPRRVLLAALVGTCSLAVVFLMVYWVNAGKPNPSNSFSQINLRSLTSTGDVYIPTVSPDGKYLAYSSLEKEGIGLRVRQIATGSIVQLMPPRPVHYWGLAFSRDSEFVYYLIGDEGENSEGVLYRIPTLGGHAEKLFQRLGGMILSKDGQHLAFGRRSPTTLGFEMVVADIDGKNQRIVIPADRPLDWRSADWSPDNKSIAYVLRHRSAEGHTWSVVEIPIDGGPEKVILPPRKTQIVMIVWLADNSGLIMNAIDPETHVAQLSFVSYPGGEEHRLTHDLNNYKEISVTADGRTIVAQKMDSLSQLWIAPNGDPDGGKPLLTAAGPAYHYLSWTPDNQILFDAHENGVDDIWKVSADGNGQSERLTYRQGKNIVPSVTPDGRYIVFISTRSGSPQLWRMDADGNDPKQLTNSSTSITEPQCSPDGKWVVYTSSVFGQTKLLKVPIDGGESSEIIGNGVGFWAISPDSKLLAYSYREREGQKPRIHLVPLAGGVPLTHFDFEPAYSLQWTRDGSGLVYISGKDNNMWVQPIAGGPPKQLTHLQPDLPLIKFAWSADGRQLAYTREVTTFDAVALQIK